MDVGILVLVGLIIVRFTATMVGYCLGTSGSASRTLRTIDRGVKESTHNVNSAITEIRMEMRETRKFVTKEVRDIANLIKVFVIVITLLALYMVYTLYITLEHLDLQIVYYLFCIFLVLVLMIKLVKILFQITLPT